MKVGGAASLPGMGPQGLQLGGEDAVGAEERLHAHGGGHVGGGEEPSGVGTPYRRATGELIRVDSTRRIVNHHGRRYEIVIYRESVEREAAETAQREAADLRAVALLASAAAHEINNPLTVVVGSLELLARHLGSDQQERRWLDRANAAAQRIRDIVARMTRITRIERTDARPGLPPMLDLHKSSDVDSPEAP